MAVGWGRELFWKACINSIISITIVYDFVWLTGSVVGVGGAEGVAASRPCPASCKGKS